MKTFLRLLLVVCVLGWPAAGCKKEQGSLNPNVNVETGDIEHGKTEPSTTNDGPSGGGPEHSK
jgi:hypothetical protein